MSANLSHRQRKFLLAVGRIPDAAGQRPPIPWPQPHTLQRWFDDPHFVCALNRARRAVHAALQLNLLQGSTAAAAQLANAAAHQSADPESTRRVSSDLIRSMRQICPDPSLIEDPEIPMPEPEPTPVDEAKYRKSVENEFHRVHPEYHGYIPPPVPPEKLPEEERRSYEFMKDLIARRRAAGWYNEQNPEPQI